jgi:hypothetical protein
MARTETGTSSFLRFVAVVDSRDRFSLVPTFYLSSRAATLDRHIGQSLFMDGEVTSGHGSFLCCKQLLPNMQWPKIGTRQRPASWYKCTLHELPAGDGGWALDGSYQGRLFVLRVRRRARDICSS